MLREGEGSGHLSPQESSSGISGISIDVVLPVVLAVVAPRVVLRLGLDFVVVRFSFDLDFELPGLAGFGASGLDVAAAPGAFSSGVTLHDNF